MLTQRLMTGFLGGALVVGLVVYGGFPGIAILTWAISMGMLYEFLSITLVKPERAGYFALVLFLGTAVLCVCSLDPEITPLFLLAAFFVLGFYATLTLSGLSKDRLRDRLNDLSFSFLGLIFLVWMPSYLMMMVQFFHDGWKWVLLLLLINWSADSGAYFVGRSFGRRKLYPTLSPGKTVEGLLGGLAAAILVTLVFSQGISLAVSPKTLVFLAGLLTLVAALGDLFESWVKRAFQVKDSGSLLPGHGGFLDRFDGLVWTAPVMYFCVMLLTE